MGVISRTFGGLLSAVGGASMIKYVIRRMLLGIPVLLAITFVAFVLIRSIPGGPFDQAGGASERGRDPLAIAALERQFGLNKEIIINLPLYRESYPRVTWTDVPGLQPGEGELQGVVDLEALGVDEDTLPDPLDIVIGQAYEFEASDGSVSLTAHLTTTWRGGGDTTDWDFLGVDPETFPTADEVYLWLANRVRIDLEDGETHDLRELRDKMDLNRLNSAPFSVDNSRTGEQSVVQARLISGGRWSNRADWSLLYMRESENSDCSIEWPEGISQVMLNDAAENQIQNLCENNASANHDAVEEAGATDFTVAMVPSVTATGVKARCEADRLDIYRTMVPEQDIIVELQDEINSAEDDLTQERDAILAAQATTDDGDGDSEDRLAEIDEMLVGLAAGFDNLDLDNLTAEQDDLLQRLSNRHTFELEVTGTTKISSALFSDLTDSQFFTYISSLLRGDFGPSLANNARGRGITVNTIIGDGLPISAQVGVFSILLGFGLGIPLGVLAAIYHNGFIDYSATFVAVVGRSVPAIVLGPFLILIFAVQLNWVDVAGWGAAPGEWLPGWSGRDPCVGVIKNAGLFGQGFLNIFNWEGYLRYTILPVFTLGTGMSAGIARLTRASLLQVLRDDYIRTARAKGLRERTVIYLHALKNALIPVATIVGPLLAGVLTGSFIIELIFAIPGLGRAFVESITNRDYNLLVGTTVLYSSFLILGNILVDVMYAWLDPRIRFD